MTDHCVICGKPLAYQGRGQPPKTCPGACRAAHARNMERERDRRARGYYERNGVVNMCKEFDKLFRQYTAAGKCHFPNKRETQASRRAVQVAREAIYQHRKACPICQCLGAPAPVSGVYRPRERQPEPDVWQLELGVTG